MELTKEIRTKIIDDLNERSIKKTTGILPKKGESFHEYGWEFYESPLDKYKNMIFVISTKMSYHNQSLKDMKYCVYAYDKKGVFVDVKESELPSQFFRTMKKM